jgi:transcriptional regulator with XRE-family HTH domain
MEKADVSQIKGSHEMLATRMGTSQGQITWLEAGADTRLSTVERYAAALGVKVTWQLEPAPRAKSA